jgi:hypothetical protein
MPSYTTNSFASNLETQMKNLLLSLFSLALLSMAACKGSDDPAPVAESNDISGDISTNRTLESGKKYLLKGFVYVINGATLTIEPGAIIMGDKATKGTLVITRGAKINASGTIDKPIIFTSAIAAGARREGDWGGIIILGKAPINPSGGEAKIEGGLVPTPGADEKNYIWYGGTDANDNSGVMKYCRIEFAGIAYSPDNEINGLTMGGVGAGTTLSYIQVYRSGDDAYEWFGGTVNADHLVATYTWDDDFDTDFGYSGHVQFGVAHRVKTIADQSGSNGFESDNDANGSTNAPQTRSWFSNMTIVGPIATANPSSNAVSGINANYQNGAQIRRNSSQSIINSVITGFPVGLYIDDSKGTATSNNITANTLMFKNNILAGCVTPFKNTAAWAGAAAWFATTNTTVLDSAQKAMMMDAYKFAPAVSSSAGRPNFLLQSASPAATGADFSGTTGFQSVGYRGAFDGTNDWTIGWTTWAAEDTAY